MMDQGPKGDCLYASLYGSVFESLTLLTTARGAGRTLLCLVKHNVGLAL